VVTEDILIGVMGVLEDRNSSYLRGPMKAPPIIRKYFYNAAVNTTSELGYDVSKYLLDMGDITPIGKTHEDIYEAVSGVISDIVTVKNLVPVTLGGDHSITFSLCRAVRDVVGVPLTIVHFDAHPDIYDSFEGDKGSHASPFARICEWPGLCNQLVQLGTRTITAHQRDQLRRFSVYSIEAKVFPACGRDVEAELRHVIPDDSCVYLSIDMDVLEPVRLIPLPYIHT
jgi:arginase